MNLFRREFSASQKEKFWLRLPDGSVGERSRVEWGQDLMITGKRAGMGIEKRRNTDYWELGTISLGNLAGSCYTDLRELIEYREYYDILIRSIIHRKSTWHSSRTYPGDRGTRHLPCRRLRLHGGPLEGTLGPRPRDHRGTLPRYSRRTNAASCRLLARAS